jgi:hypothetical protein
MANLLDDGVGLYLGSSRRVDLDRIYCRALRTREGCVSVGISRNDNGDEIVRQGEAHATQAADGWLHELGSRDCMPEPMSDKWQLVTVATLVRLVIRMTVELQPSSITRRLNRYKGIDRYLGSIDRPSLLWLNRSVST